MYGVEIDYVEKYKYVKVTSYKKLSFQKHSINNISKQIRN